MESGIKLGLRKFNNDFTLRKDINISICFAMFSLIMLYFSKYMKPKYAYDFEVSHLYFESR